MQGDTGEPATNPVLVEVLRGETVESFHRGAVAVCDASGVSRFTLGDVEQPVFPRSAVKPILTLSFIETGAADAVAASPAEIALACASHSGAPGHAAVARGLLDRVGGSPEMLECGSHIPLGKAEAEAMLRADKIPTPLDNTCSGKHAAMIATAIHLGEDVAGYVAADHPVQQRVRRVVEDMADVDLSGAAVATDGCSIPTIAMPLSALARAMAQFANPSALSPARAEGCRRIRAAMAAHPEMVAGVGRCDTAVIAAAGENALAKTGAEGVYCAALTGLGLGLALKIDDGGDRAAEVALIAVLGHLGVLDAAAVQALSTFARSRVLTRRGVEAGELRPAAGWL